MDHCHIRESKIYIYIPNVADPYGCLCHAECALVSLPVVGPIDAGGQTPLALSVPAVNPFCLSPKALLTWTVVGIISNTVVFVFCFVLFWPEFKKALGWKK